MTKKEIIQDLKKIQNHPKLVVTDILTITAFMNIGQLIRHLEKCKERIVS